MGLISKNITSTGDLQATSEVGDNLLLLSASTGIFVMSCIAFFIYYHMQVCRYIVETRMGTRHNNYFPNYYSKRS